MDEIGSETRGLFALRLLMRMGRVEHRSVDVRNTLKRGREWKDEHTSSDIVNLRRTFHNRDLMSCFR